MRKHIRVDRPVSQFLLDHDPRSEAARSNDPMRRADQTGATAMIELWKSQQVQPKPVTSSDVMAKAGQEGVNRLIADTLSQRKQALEQFLRDNPDHRKIVSGPDLKEMLDSLSIGNAVANPVTNPMVRFRLAKAFNGLHNVSAAILVMGRVDQMSTTQWSFEALLTYEDSDKIGQYRLVKGTYDTRSKTGIIQFHERKED